MLYIVSTPIGNLEDITLRAVRVLKEADLILCEDTRTARRLLKHHGIDTPTESFASNDVAKGSSKKLKRIISRLDQGQNIALVSESGTPGISDPGSLLVSRVREELGGAAVAAVPGASALTAALAVSGLPITSFTFFGFLPHKKGREKLFREIAASSRASVFYESPHRITKTFVSLAEHAPEKTVTICREMTKVYEEVISGTAKELLDILEKEPERQRGEFVVIVG